MPAGQGRGAEFFDVGKAGGQAYGYKQNVPQVGVDRQDGGFVVEAACVGENGDAAEEAVVHQEGEQGLAGAGGAEPGEDQEDVHGDAAELEGEIPPLVDAVVLTEGEIPLLPELTARHEEAAEQKKMIQFLGGNPVFHFGLLMYLERTYAHFAYPFYIVYQLGRY